jgi:hypothetical protein
MARIGTFDGVLMPRSLVHGEFKINDGRPEIDLYDKNGRVFWSTNARMIPIGK